ncbi:MAG: hypothetical protein CLLPBCKN_005228 [Chroococcidiopsis cubana SAG 39.79]|jgi:uncharacterized protein|uniref:SpoVT-AbrB domain-containing protein n=2 Tax=Chroococcidiopsis TaxID=54298 RepID=K9U627_CHRTP|nr:MULTISPECIES: hypothetical protein [Chroococcidiopsis]AFY89709.1 hypothetical protein Chro_4313 [Chroococcidiopsis thermalis PCC 7203]MDZ4875808.1 hypothetical protein [Chroococcidiopsis cubana SAG 39.79]RUT07493.1 hypothetical protein DSM107010_49650 [Chroococcidiopsis cubana SAG 39.79]URD49091.1 hypothetical protein M5J74_22540 [Chroococcidiopsis sp. CCNUC1]
MMPSVEFQARVENGKIVIPEEYQQELSEVATVKIVILKQSRKQITPFDIMDELAQNPVSISGIRMISREEMHER